MSSRRIAHFEVIRLIATGGMGEVYLARDVRLDREVALKVIRPELVSADQRLRLMREARAASALNHPNVAHVYDVGDDGDQSYIAMEYVAGRSLEQILRERRLSATEVLDIARAVAAVLVEAHQRSIVHRDIKPANIMVNERGEVKVLDFGLAKLPPRADDRTLSNPDVVLGTVQYMSPEQALGHDVDARSDIFSFGIVLYQISTGARPFEGTSVTDTLNRIINAPPAAHPESSASLPLQVIIHRCLQKAPEDRYQSAADLLADLEEVRQGHPPQHAMTRRRRSRTRIAIATSALLAVVIAITAVWWFTHRGDQIKSIAVMPFANETGDPSVNYISDGLTDSLIDTLTGFDDVRVVPRRTIFRYKPADVERAGRELGVGAVLTGRVSRAARGLQVHAELTDIRGERQLWGEGFEARPDQIVSVHDRIAAAVGRRIAARPSDVRALVQARSTENPRAYELYLQGRFLLARRTREDLQRAERVFDLAVREDPSYALAWAGLAETYILFAARRVIPPPEARAKAHAAASRALALDDRLAEVQTALADLKFTDEWDWRGAEEGFRRAIAMDPYYVTAHHWYAFYLAYMGRSQEAIREINAARALDPASPHLIAAAAWVHSLAGDERKAIELCKEALSLDPESSSAWTTLSGSYFALKQWPQWADTAARYYDLIGQHEDAAAIRDGFAAGGVRGATLRRLELLKKRAAAGKDVSPSSFFQCYVRLGEKEEAMKWLEKMYAERSDMLLRVRVDSGFDAVRSEPQFKELVKRMGL